VFVDLVVYGLMIPVLPGYASGLGASRSTLGLLVGTFGIAVVAATPLFGVLSDRYGSRWPMVGGLLGLATSTLLFAYAPGLGWLFVARAFQASPPRRAGWRSWLFSRGSTRLLRGAGRWARRWPAPPSASSEQVVSNELQ
jgi:MFS family permease